MSDERVLSRLSKTYRNHVCYSITGQLGYGYGYDNYYNYMMMAAMSNSYSTSETSERSLDKDRFYCGVLNGPGAAGKKPSLKITFSAPKTAER